MAWPSGFGDDDGFATGDRGERVNAGILDKITGGTRAAGGVEPGVAVGGDEVGGFNDGRVIGFEELVEGVDGSDAAGEVGGFEETFGFVDGGGDGRGVGLAVVDGFVKNGHSGDAAEVTAELGGHGGEIGGDGPDIEDTGDDLEAGFASSGDGIGNLIAIDAVETDGTEALGGEGRDVG